MLHAFHLTKELMYHDTFIGTYTNHYECLPSDGNAIANLVLQCVYVERKRQVYVAQFKQQKIKKISFDKDGDTDIFTKDVYSQCDQIAR